MVRLIFASILFVTSVFTSICANADVLFEGYSKILSGGVHVGFTVARYEFDNKKNQFSFTYLLKTNELAGSLIESIHALSKSDMTPILYSYTSLQGVGKDAVTKTIDAKFSKGKMFADIKVGGKISKIKKDLPKGTFLSYFLAYAMLRNPKGITADTKYNYQAIAEEDAEVVKGIAYIKGLEDVNGMKAFKVLNEFKDTKFISYMTDKGELLSTKSPVQGIASELVAQSTAATAGMQIPTSLIKTLFGDVPLGNKNPMATKSHDK
jgi:hypothetical protein